MNDGNEGRAPSSTEVAPVHDVPASVAASDLPAYSGCYRFESFEVDGVRRELRRHGLKIHLKGRPFTLLKVLVESQGRVVTREELRGHLWSSDTHVDFDANLTTAFYKVRKALGDSSRESKFIETIPGVGYRFIEPILRIKNELEALPLPAAADEIGRDSAASSKNSVRSRGISPLSRRLVSVLIAAMVLVVIAYVGYVRAFSSGATRPLSQRLLVLPFSETEVNAADVHFSDGLQDDLITELANRHASEFSVIARTTATTYKDTTKSVQEIARELNVSYVVEGCVQRDAGRVHISARLIRAADQSEIWGESYDRTFGNPLDTESEVAVRIGDGLSAQVAPSLTAAEQRSAESHPYENYLKRLLSMR